MIFGHGPPWDPKAAFPLSGRRVVSAFIATAFA